MLIKQFEDIKVWQDARVLTKQIYGVTKVGNFSKDYGLRDQIQRASVSIMSNIVEGYERDSNREFTKFLSYAKGSAGEVRNLLYVALDQEYLTQLDFEKLKHDCLDISKQISGFTTYLRKTAK